jgi:hypothetical protein
MTPADVYIDFFERVLENGVAVVGGLDADQLAHRPTADANSIAWLVWHAARVQDAQIADVAGTEQVWFTQSWADRFGLDLDSGDTGYGHTAEQVGKVRAGGELLAAYLTAAHQATVDYLKTVTEADLDRIVDERWTPPVSLGVRLVSIADDDAQHLGQAAYLRGVLDY